MNGSVPHLFLPPVLHFILLFLRKGQWHVRRNSSSSVIDEEAVCKDNLWSPRRPHCSQMALSDLYSYFLLILKESGLHLTQKTWSHLLSFIQVVLDIFFFQNFTAIYQHKLPFVGQTCITSLKTDITWKYHYLRHYRSKNNYFILTS